MFSKTVFCLFMVCVCSAIEIDDSVFEELIKTVSDLEKRVRLQDELISVQQIKIDDLQITNTELTEKTIATRQVTSVTQPPIAFCSKLTPHVTRHLHTGSGVIFDKVLTNYGQGYDNSTGIFTVPLYGIYLFSTSVLDAVAKTNTGGFKVHAEIIRNNQTLARAFAHAEDNYRDQGAQTVIVEVNAGDEIWIRITDNNDLGLGGDQYTTFCGYMLWQME